MSCAKNPRLNDDEGERSINRRTVRRGAVNSKCNKIHVGGRGGSVSLSEVSLVLVVSGDVGCEVVVVVVVCAEDEDDEEEDEEEASMRIFDSASNARCFASFTS